MKKAMIWVGLVLLGLAIGGVSAILAARQPFGGVEKGAWTASIETGSDKADPWTRARVAVQALLAMTRDQAVYFTSHHDSEGRAFDAACRYTIRGGDHPARWWSVTIYDDAYFLIENEAKRYSVTAATLALDEAGRWSARIAADEKADLIAPESGAFNLILRFYHPEPGALQDPTALSLPVITREGCA